MLVGSLVAGCAAVFVGAIAGERSRGPLVASFIAASSLASMVVSWRVLRSRRAVGFRSRQLLPVTGVSLHLDPLGAFFVLVTGLLSLAVAIYLVGYSRRHPLTRTSAAATGAFVFSLLLVPEAWSVMTFMLGWELMAATSLVLLLGEYRHRGEVRQAALWYAVLTQVGASAIVLVLAVLAARTGGQGFTTMARHVGSVPLWLRGALFVVALAGFASKAGAVPLHVWLPKAHGEAPSPVSALMSGSMVNLGIYGVLRLGLTLLGGGAPWWWVVVLALGVISAVYGSIHAATSRDAKRLLAYSTTDNVGLVLIAVGTSGLLVTTHHPAYAALAMFAALFHLLSHSLAKGCLFLSAGSVQYATGTRDLDALGGLARRMPVATGVFTIGAGAIAALPPLCGFVSEWLLLQSLLHGLSNSSAVSVVVTPLCVAALALTGGLTASAFVKFLGVGFLGTPRTAAAATAREVPVAMNLGAGLLAAGCLVVGVVPMAFVGLLRSAVAATGVDERVMLGTRGSALVITGARELFDPTMVAIALVVSIGVVALARHLLARSQAARRVPAWGCGREGQSARMSYTATSFAEPLERVFDDVLRPSRDLDVSHRAESRYFAESVRYQTRRDDAIERLVFRPVFAGVRALARGARLAQNGSVHRYLAYGFAVVLIILVVAR